MHCCVSASCQRHTILFIVFLWRTLISTVIMYYLFLVVLGFELRALNLVGKCSTAWVMPPVLAYFSYFSDRILCLWSSYASRVTGITGISYHVWLILFFNFYSESICKCYFGNLVIDTHMWKYTCFPFVLPLSGLDIKIILKSQK
jgi:hypothetical protein